MKADKFRWTQKKLGKLMTMKLVGHRSYKQISQKLGCSTAQAFKAYYKHFYA